MKLAKLILPAVAVMAMAMGSIAAQAADKVKIGVAMAVKRWVAREMSG